MDGLPVQLAESNECMVVDLLFFLSATLRQTCVIKKSCKCERKKNAVNAYLKSVVQNTVPALPKNKKRIIIIIIIIIKKKKECS